MGEYLAGLQPGAPFILPWMSALGLVNHLFVAYRSLSLVQLAVPFLFGAGWGIWGADGSLIPLRLLEEAAAFNTYRPTSD